MKLKLDLDIHDDIVITTMICHSKSSLLLTKINVKIEQAYRIFTISFQLESIEKKLQFLFLFTKCFGFSFLLLFVKPLLKTELNFPWKVILLQLLAQHAQNHSHL